ncbi:ataxin-7-like protein 3 isoform X2 [Aplysia californica]|uniref:SAGA-associated factor 11 homolog n=1 Tax=Aplysia californica TaxID=6500 RepID=A0ABM0K8G4_APLCA|nr:ataxin-7-like protein 3 isoform X2 [Aplysia californica]
MVEADISQGQGDFDPDMRAALDSIVEELIDEVSLGLCFEIHRSCKVGSMFLNGFDDISDTEYAIIDRPGMDVLGQVPSKKNYECVCPNCQRNLAASRFAPHLEKCMGMGRNSSRIASRRIANNQKHGGSEESGQEDENDNDWNYAPESKRLRKLKKDKMSNSPRNRRLVKLRNGNNNSQANAASAAATAAAAANSQSATNSSGATSVPGSELSGTRDHAEPPYSSLMYESMTVEERKALLLTSCGVISEHTKKMCTRTGKCVQHTDEQRRQVRQQLLRQSRAHDLEDIHIDIDTYDDTETQTLRESLQWEASSNSSPADSTSTNNSTSGVATSAATSAPSTAPAAPAKRPSSKASSKPSKNKKQKVAKHSASSSSSASSSRDHAGAANLYDFS